MPNDPQGLQNLMTLAVQQALGRIPVSYMPATSQPQTPKAAKEPKQTPKEAKKQTKTAESKIQAPPMPTPPPPPDTQGSKILIEDTDEAIDAWLRGKILEKGESLSWSAGGSTVDEEGNEKAKSKTRKEEVLGDYYIYNKALGRYQTRAEARGWARQILRRQGLLKEKKEENNPANTEVSEGGGTTPTSTSTATAPSANRNPQIGDDDRFSGTRNQPYQAAQTEETFTPDRGTIQDLLALMQTPQQTPSQQQAPVAQTSPLEGLIKTIKGGQQQQALAQQMQPQQIAVATLSRLGLNTNTPEFQAIAERASKLPPATLGALTTIVQRESSGNPALTQFIMDGLLQLYGV